MSDVPELPTAATWARMQTFMTLYEGGSVRAAADVLHVTPPAVSASIAALEHALGTKLFDRAGRGIVPTDAGETLAGYVRKLFGLLTEAAGAVLDPDRGQVRIGAVATASEYVLPRLLASFSREHPQVSLSLSVLPRDELFSQAADHAVDVVLAGRPPKGSGLVTRARRPNQLVLVGRPDLRDDPLTTTWLLRGPGSGTRDATLSLLALLQASPPLLTLGTAGAVVAAAREGLGVTVVHRDAVRDHLDDGDLVVYAVPETPLDRPWHLCTAAVPTAATRLFLQHVCDSGQVGASAFHATSSHTRSRPSG